MIFSVLIAWVLAIIFSSLDDWNNVNLLPWLFFFFFPALIHSAYYIQHYICKITSKILSRQKPSITHYHYYIYALFFIIYSQANIPASSIILNYRWRPPNFMNNQASRSFFLPTDFLLSLLSFSMKLPILFYYHFLIKLCFFPTRSCYDFLCVHVSLYICILKHKLYSHLFLYSSLSSSVHYFLQWQSIFHSSV